MPVKPRPVALVWLESTITEGANHLNSEIGQVVPGVKEALIALSATHDITILSAFARNIPGRKRVSAFMQANALPFSCIWDGPGVPPHESRYDNFAQLLSSDSPAKRVKSS